MTPNTSIEQDRIQILQAALEVAGIESIIPIVTPLPKERRQHLYVVPDEHQLGKIYGVSKLSATLLETKTPHLTDYDPSSTRKGLRYIDNANPIPEDLVPFTSEDARRAWRDFLTQKQKETRALADAAQTAGGQSDMRAMEQAFPASDAAIDLHPLPQKPISKKTSER
jgi:hypothetical protein